MISRLAVGRQRPISGGAKVEPLIPEDEMFHALTLVEGRTVFLGDRGGGAGPVSALSTTLTDAAAAFRRAWHDAVGRMRLAQLDDRLARDIGHDRWGALPVAGKAPWHG